MDSPRSAQFPTDEIPAVLEEREVIEGDPSPLALAEQNVAIDAQGDDIDLVLPVVGPPLADAIREERQARMAAPGDERAADVLEDRPHVIGEPGRHNQLAEADVHKSLVCRHRRLQLRSRQRYRPYPGSSTTSRPPKCQTLAPSHPGVVQACWATGQLRVIDVRKTSAGRRVRCD